MQERDDRPLSEIQFALDARDPVERARITVQIRGMLALQGVKVAQDIIEKGCTGLVCPAPGREQVGLTLDEAEFIRENMAGSICGLPCYVPPDRFCLVHRGVGGLQRMGNADGPQLLRHPEGVPLCSRELTDEEARAVGAIRKKLLQDAADAAKALGLEAAASEVEVQEVDPLVDTSKRPSTSGGTALDNGFGSFVCVEHAEFNPACRFCLAQAVAEGPLDPQQIIWRAHNTQPGAYSARTLDQELSDPENVEVQFYVLAARWVRKLTRV